MSDKQREARIKRLQQRLQELIDTNAPVGQRLAVSKMIEAEGK